MSRLSKINVWLFWFTFKSKLKFNVSIALFYLYGFTYFVNTYPTGIYCEQPNMTPLLPLSTHNDSPSTINCALICQSTDGCLGYHQSMEGMCKLVQTSTYSGSTTQPELVYYEICWSKSINMWIALYIFFSLPNILATLHKERERERGCVCVCGGVSFKR